MTAIDASLIAAGLVAGVGIDAGAARFARRERPGPPAGGGGVSTLATKLLSGFAGAAVVFVAVRVAPPELGVFTAVFGCLLLTLANIDLRTMLLPDPLNATLLLFGAAMVWLSQRDNWLIHAAGAALGFGSLWAVETGYRRLRGRNGLGRGDAKLLGAIGIWVGAAGLPPVLLIASLSGILAALAQSWCSGRSIGAQTAIAFGPWIALGGFATWILSFAAPTMFGL